MIWIQANTTSYHRKVKFRAGCTLDAIQLNDMGSVEYPPDLMCQYWERVSKRGQWALSSWTQCQQKEGHSGLKEVKRSNCFAKYWKWK